jgi:predicted DNA-binding protein with PD1-like motif
LSKRSRKVDTTSAARTEDDEERQAIGRGWLGDPRRDPPIRRGSIHDAHEIRQRCRHHGGSLTAIGAFERATVGWFDFEKKTYKKIEVAEQCEVLSAIGDIAVGDDGKASLHVHVVLGLADGTTRGGHLLEGKVRPTLEVVIADTPVHLRRKKKPDLGIALIDIAKERRDGSVWSTPTRPTASH